MQVLIKPKVEADRGVDDNQHVQILKKKIHILQQQKQDLEMQHTKLQKSIKSRRRKIKR
jgi:hypothetical protein